MNAGKTGRKKSRAELYRPTKPPRTKSQRPREINSDPEPEFHMTQVQTVIFWSCAGVGLIASWVLQAVLGMTGFITTTIMSGIGGGVGGLVGILIVFLILTPGQKRKHVRRKKK